MTFADFLRSLFKGPDKGWQPPAPPSPQLQSIALQLATEKARSADLSERLSDMRDRLRFTEAAALRERESTSTLREELGAARAAAEAAETGLQASQAALAAAQQARQRAEVDADTIRAALDASERGLAASQQALVERTTQLDTANTSIVAEKASFGDFVAALPPTLPSPPPFNVAYVSTSVSVVRAAIEPLLAPDFITGRTTPPDYTDASYNLFHPMDIVPFCDYWRANLMPPARGEESDCDDRAFAFAVDLHRWSGYRIRCGVVQVTAEWALVNGNRWPHYIPVAVAPDGTPWCIDPAFLAQPEPFIPTRVQVLRGIFY